MESKATLVPSLLMVGLSESPSPPTPLEVALDERHGPGGQVFLVDVAAAAGGRRHEVVGRRREGDDGPVGGDGGMGRQVVGLGSVSRGAGQGEGAADEVLDVDLRRLGARVAGREFHESDAVAVGADGRVETEAAELVAAGVGADERDGPRLHVLDEDVGRGVGVVGYQVVGVAHEGDVPAVGADRRIERAARVAAVGRRIAGRIGGSDEGEGAGLQIFAEDVAGLVGVAGRQVVGLAVEDEVPAVGGEGGAARGGEAAGAVPLRRGQASSDERDAGGRGSIFEQLDAGSGFFLRGNESTGSPFPPGHAKPQSRAGGSSRMLRRCNRGEQNEKRRVDRGGRRWGAGEDEAIRRRRSKGRRIRLRKPEEWIGLPQPQTGTLLIRKKNRVQFLT